MYLSIVFNYTMLIEQYYTFYIILTSMGIHKQLNIIQCYLCEILIYINLQIYLYIIFGREAITPSPLHTSFH